MSFSILFAIIDTNYRFSVDGRKKCRAKIIKTIYAAILGAGTVGTGVYKLCQEMKSEFVQKTGADLVVKKVLVRNASKKREGIEDAVLTDNWKEIIEDPEIDIVIEVMGGIEPAKTYIIEALEAGKQIVTANKDLLAEHGQEVMAAAEKAGADLEFEAAVAGAIPIIRPLKQSMAGNRISEVMGIVNGTTNYILTKCPKRHGLCRSTGTGNRAWLCGSRPDS